MQNVKKTNGEVELKLQTISLWHYTEVSGQIHIPAAFASGDRTSLSIK